MKKKKREIYIGGHPIKAYLPIVFFFSIVAAICIVLGAVEEPSLFVEVSAVYLLIVFLVYYYSNHEDIQHKNFEIAELKEEVRKLESLRESDKRVIELLGKELEKAHFNSQKGEENCL